MWTYVKIWWTDLHLAIYMEFLYNIYLLLSMFLDWPTDRYDLLHNAHLNLEGLDELFQVAQVQFPNSTFECQNFSQLCNLWSANASTKVSMDTRSISYLFKLTTSTYWCPGCAWSIWQNLDSNMALGQLWIVFWLDRCQVILHLVINHWSWY